MKRKTAQKTKCDHTQGGGRGFWRKKTRLHGYGREDYTLQEPQSVPLLLLFQQASLRRKRVGLLAWTTCRFVMHCTTETKKPQFSARQQSRSAIREKYMHNADGSIHTQHQKALNLLMHGFEVSLLQAVYKTKRITISCVRLYFPALRKTCFICYGFTGYQTEQEPLRDVILNTCPSLPSAWGPGMLTFH